MTYYCKERVEAEGITNISCQQHRVVGPSADDLDALVELIDLFLNHIDEEKKKETGHLLRIVRAMPLDEVLSGGMGSIVPGRGRVDKRRARL
ncbi:MAG: hypothetical protein OEU92_05690 [Alphaproteobacteria bacterium]|nr:hypothetical protein [Alphaproteobacteria bacterium]